MLQGNGIMGLMVRSGYLKKYASYCPCRHIEFWNRFTSLMQRIHFHYEIWIEKYLPILWSSLNGFPNGIHFQFGLRNTYLFFGVVSMVFLMAFTFNLD